MIVNKYGAVDVEEIIRIRDEAQKEIKGLKWRCLRLENLIEKMAGVDDMEITPEMGYDNGWYNHCKKEVVDKLPTDIKKMKELTKCDDYVYETTPAKTKLVKKQRKLTEDA